MRLFPETEAFMVTSKPEYERPEITYYGELTELTEGQSNGNTFDGNFTTGQTVPPAFLSCRPGGPPCVTFP
jgi:hypothetical protein